MSNSTLKKVALSTFIILLIITIFVCIGKQEESKKHNARTLTFNSVIDSGEAINWTTNDCTVLQDEGVNVVQDVSNTFCNIYKQQTLTDDDFPFEVQIECSGIREFDLAIVLFDEALSKTFYAEADLLQIDGINSYRFDKSDFSTSTGMTWDEVAYFSIGTTPYQNETVEYTLIRILGGVSGETSVLFTFDDGFKSVIDIAKPIMDSKRYKGTAYVVPLWLGSENLMNTEELQKLYSGGWDIANHGYGHLGANTGSMLEIENDYRQCITWLETNDMPRARFHLAYPDGEITDNSNIAAKKAGILTARTIIPGYNTGFGNNLYLYTLLLENTSTLSDFTSAYEKAEELGSSLCVVIHDVTNEPEEIYQISTDLLQSMVDYCSENNVNVQTITEWYD